MSIGGTTPVTTPVNTWLGNPYDDLVAGAENVDQIVAVRYFHARDRVNIDHRTLTMPGCLDAGARYERYFYTAPLADGPTRIILGAAPFNLAGNLAQGGHLLRGSAIRGRRQQPGNARNQGPRQPRNCIRNLDFRLPAGLPPGKRTSLGGVPMRQRLSPHSVGITAMLVLAALVAGLLTGVQDSKAQAPPPPLPLAVSAPIRFSYQADGTPGILASDVGGCTGSYSAGLRVRSRRACWHWADAMKPGW